eukprot:scaffold10055_cov101-Isochrysis_galbana.AAC.6
MEQLEQRSRLGLAPLAHPGRRRPPILHVSLPLCASGAGECPHRSHHLAELQKGSSGRVGGRRLAQRRQHCREWHVPRLTHKLGSKAQLGWLRFPRLPSMLRLIWRCSRRCWRLPIA